MPAPEVTWIEVVHALPARQRVVRLPLTPGLTALQAVRESGLLDEFPELRGQALVLGIFGRRVDDLQELRDGDRVEIYRPLRLDPREARRAAAHGAGRGRPHGKD